MSEIVLNQDEYSFAYLNIERILAYYLFFELVHYKGLSFTNLILAYQNVRDLKFSSNPSYLSRIESVPISGSENS